MARRQESDEVIDAPTQASALTAAHVAQTRDQSIELEAGPTGLTMDLSMLEDGPSPAAAPVSDEGPSLEDIERIRRMRKPMGEFSQKLALPTRRGYKRHWFNDQPGRVSQAQDAGWSFVLGTDKQPLRRVVDKAREGGALYAYAMEIPEIFWLEDMAKRHGVAKARMDSLKQNPFGSARGKETARPEDGQKFYSPTDSDPLEIRGPGL